MSSVMDPVMDPRDGHRGMAEHLTHHLRVDARTAAVWWRCGTGWGSGSAALPPSPRDHEAAQQITREEGTSCLVAVDQFAVVPRRTNRCTLPFLALPVATQHVSIRRC